MDQVLREIDRILDIWKRPFIEFVDDNALADRRYWMQLLGELAHRKVRWFAESDISIGEDEQLLDLMRESGCREILIGLESPSREQLHAVELNSNWKYRSHSKYRSALSNIQQHGIRLIGCFIVGLDGQTPECFDQIYEFVRETALFDVQVTLQTAFPGTPLFSRLERSCRLKSPEAHNLCTLFDLNIVPDRISSEQLVTEFRRLLRRLHNNSPATWRHQQFKKHLRRLRQQDLKQTWTDRITGVQETIENTTPTGADT